MSEPKRWPVTITQKSEVLGIARMVKDIPDDSTRTFVDAADYDALAKELEEAKATESATTYHFDRLKRERDAAQALLQKEKNWSKAVEENRDDISGCLAEKTELLKEAKEIADFNLDCGDNSCRFAKQKDRGGLRTNGGCRCLENNRNEVLKILFGLRTFLKRLEGEKV